MTKRVGINGFGRIGRQALKAIMGRYPDDLEVVAINDPTGPSVGTHLLKYDSTYGRFPGEVSHTGDELVVDEHKIKFFSEFELEKIPWADLNVDVVVESTGKFVDAHKAKTHITSGKARKVIISAPAKNEDLTVVLGVNGGEYNSESHHVVSNASCTTNCVAPMAKVLHDAFGIERAFMSTIHAYTNDQRIQDMGHSDMRRARAAAVSIIPTTTGAAKAVTKVIPELEGRIDGMAYRVPTITGSVTDLTAQLSKEASIDEINAAFKTASEGELQGILEYSDEPLVSADYVGSSYSCTLDGLSTAVLPGGFIKIVGWYDNEWGYSSRLADLTAYV